MGETYISFYLKANRIRVFIEALRRLGRPNRICFLLDDDLRNIIVAPYAKKDLKSHKVPLSSYSQPQGVEVCSKKLCRIIAQAKNWDVNHSYCAPGKVLLSQNIAIFDLDAAFAIKPIVKENSSESN